MKNYSNTYIFIYASVMVIAVAAILSFVAMTLKPIQKRNIEVEKKMNILSSVRIQSTPENAEELYDKYIIKSGLVNSNGEFVTEIKDENNDIIKAFDVDLKLELKKPVEERNMPVFFARLDDNKELVVVPVMGKGLWGPIWGYVSFKTDYNTIYGAVFDHKGETPGLGAEIANKDFQEQFLGKQIYNNENEFVSVSVIKGGVKSQTSVAEINGVDAISGGTITSKGLDKMLKDCLGFYDKYFSKNKN
ncbi:MAG: Na(+)-translocating NADH-quinone reductase subunit C [Marinilabiliales bacterium]